MTYTDYLKLTSQDIGKMTEGELRAIISDLNDVANKRVKRMEKTGVAIASPAYQALKASGSTRFKIGRGETDKQALKEAYSKVRTFLSAEKTGSITGTREYMAGMRKATEKVLKQAMKEAGNLDKRFKKPTLKKSIKDKVLTDFWTKYNEWAEINRRNNPNAWQEGSPIERVAEFYEEYYEQGKVSLEEYEEGSQEEYEEQETERIQDNEIDFGRTAIPVKRKYKRGRKSNKDEPTQRFEQIKIF